MKSDRSMYAAGVVTKECLFDDSFDVYAACSSPAVLRGESLEDAHFANEHVHRSAYSAREALKETIEELRDRGLTIYESAVFVVNPVGTGIYRHYEVPARKGYQVA